MRYLVIKFAFWLLYLANYELPVLIAYVAMPQAGDLDEKTAQQTRALVH
jgi:hypothetical protein